MTLRIEIIADPARPLGLREQVEQAGAAIGLFPQAWFNLRPVVPAAGPDEHGPKQGDEHGCGPAPETPATVLDEPSVQAAIRKRGQPSPGKKRRTAAEVAEDEAADAADAAEARYEADAEERLNGGPQISTGENRVGPEDDPEVEEQDRADEAAEAAATRSAGLTLDDVRNAVGRYQKKFGMPAAIKDVPVLLGKQIIELDDDELAGAIEKIDAAIAAGRPGEAAQPAPAAPAAPAAPEPPPAKPATKEDVQAAMMAYAKTFDGPTANPGDPTSMPHTLADCPKIFQLVCKDDSVVRLSLVPVEKYGAVIAGIGEAIAKDPFRRGAK